MWVKQVVRRLGEKEEEIKNWKKKDQLSNFLNYSLGNFPLRAKITATHPSVKRVVYRLTASGVKVVKKVKYNRMSESNIIY